MQLQQKCRLHIQFNLYFLLIIFSLQLWERINLIYIAIHFNLLSCINQSLNMSWMVLEVGKNQRHMMAIKAVCLFLSTNKLYGHQIKFVARTHR